MRFVASALLLLTLTFSGCLQAGNGNGSDALDRPGGLPRDGWTDSQFDWTGLNTTYPYDALVQYCVDAGNCTYWDGQFHEGVVYELDTLIMDAVVLPVPGVDTMAATRAAGQATAAWADVNQFAAPWFVDAWHLNTYVVGDGIPSADFVTDPEIIVVSESGQRSTSIGLNPEQVACTVLNDFPLPPVSPPLEPGTLATKVYPVHEHDGMAIFAAECITGGFRCAALNFASALGGTNGLYGLVAHEVGHCLGLSHVGDALDFNSRFVPTTDIMSYANNPSKVPCVSTLNARVMEGIYAELAGQEAPEWIQNGTRFAMGPWDFKTVDCKNPEPAIICCNDEPRPERGHA